MAELWDHITDIVVALDSDWRYTLFNRAAEGFFGRPREAVIGRQVGEGFEGLLPADAISRLQTVVASKQSAKFRYHFTEKDMWFLTHVYPIPGGILIWSSEITHEVTLETTNKALVEELQKALEEAEASRIVAESARMLAENASRARERFIAALSHELRTPLTPAMANLELLEQMIEDKDARILLEIMKRNLRLEAQLITDLLDVSMAVNSKLEIERHPVDVHATIANIVGMCRPAASAKEQRIRFKLFAQQYVVPGDPIRIQQILWNVLNNAIKFTPNGGHIDLCTRNSPECLIIEIEDSGEGIKPEYLDLIFNKFDDIERGAYRHFNGLGLGLAISKHLVQLHGGKIIASSDGKGKGSCFTIELPLQYVEDGRRSPSPAATAETRA
jgi:signal transduction histidine kinase